MGLRIPSKGSSEEWNIDTNHSNIYYGAREGQWNRVSTRTDSNRTDTPGLDREVAGAAVATSVKHKNLVASNSIPDCE